MPVTDQGPDGPDNRTVFDLDAAAVYEAVMSLDAEHWRARADGWASWYTALTERLEVLTALSSTRKAWQGQAAAAHHTRADALIRVLEAERDGAHNRYIAAQAAAAQVRKAQHDLQRLFPNGPPPSVPAQALGRQHPRQPAAAAIAVELAEAMANLGAGLPATAAWSKAEREARRRTARNTSRPASPGSHRGGPRPRRGLLLGRVIETEPDQKPVASGPVIAVLGRRRPPESPPSAETAGHSPVLGRRQSPTTAGQQAASTGTGRLLGTRALPRSIEAPPLPAAPDPVPVATDPAPEFLPACPAPFVAGAESEPVERAAPSTRSALDAITDLLAGSTMPGEIHREPALLAVEGTDDAAPDELLRLVATRLRETDAGGRREPHAARPLAVAAADRALRADQGTLASEVLTVLSGQRLVVRLTPASLGGGNVWQSLGTALVEDVNRLLEATPGTRQRYWLAHNCPGETAGQVRDHLRAVTRTPVGPLAAWATVAAVLDYLCFPARFALNHIAVAATALAGAAVASVGWWHDRRKRQLAVDQFLPAILLRGPATVHPVGPALPHLPGPRIGADPAVLTEQTTRRILHEYIHAGLDIVIVLPGFDRYPPRTRNRVWDTMRDIHHDYPTRVRIALSYAPDALAASLDNPDDAWQHIDRLALLALPVPDGQDASNAARNASVEDWPDDLRPVREELLARAERLGLPERMTAKLLAMWRFYVSMLPDTPTAGAARSVAVLVEILVRYPAVRPRLVRVPAGRTGLRWLATAAADDEEWDRALTALGLNDPSYQASRNEIRALLTTPEAEGIADVLPTLSPAANHG
jgi:hypothetical protein